MKIWVSLVILAMYRLRHICISRRLLMMKIVFFVKLCLFFKQNEIVSDRIVKNVILFLYWNLCVIGFKTIPILSVWNVRIVHTRPLKVGIFGPNLLIHDNDYSFDLMLPIIHMTVVISVIFSFEWSIYCVCISAISRFGSPVYNCYGNSK